MSTQVAADLRAAADVLERDGWTQGNFHNECGHCVEGAIDAAAGFWLGVGDYDASAVQRCLAAEWALLTHLNLDGYLPDWNDAPGRTAAEVIAVLRAAADRAEADQ